jgi:hypothetical protein
LAIALMLGGNALAQPAPVFVACPTSTAQVGVAYSSAFVASGGVPPYSPYFITSGSLPPGLTENILTGAITGTPTTAGTFNFTVLVFDSKGTPGSSDCTIVVSPPAPYSTYFVTYYSNANAANAPDATLRIINDGATGASMFADIYVFDDSEELQECCGCVITPDGLLSESVNKNLTANPITGIKPTRGVIKIIPDAGLTSSVAESPANAGHIPLSAGLSGWATHVQKLASGFAVSEGELAGADLSPSEEVLLQELCYFDAQLSGKSCTCTVEDNDF